MGRAVRILGIASILFGACLMGGLGSLYLLDPASLREAADISPETPAALAEIRSTYGGLHVGIALFLVTCAMGEATRRTGLLFCTLAFAGAGIARFAGIRESGVADPEQSVIASLELTFSAITFLLHRHWPPAPQPARGQPRP